MYGVYALLWFGKGEVAILKCGQSIYGVGSEFDDADFQRLYYLQSAAEFAQVNSQYARTWRIRAKDYSGFFDPRVGQ
jgi:hypothetical protein